ncbi:MAG: SDR family NAD(P)-dependent oxidoreductase [Myxococcales bacterium FL481]|nr:MAG: SDR family NAD(P)-dependent oxidoreductase [Myxococcales bacterium FL481]
MQNPTEIETKYLNRLIAEHTQDMAGKIVAITGTTSGTGYVCARELAKLGATVLLLNRDSPRSRSALETLQAEVPGATFEPITCDLQNFDSVRAAAREISSRRDRLDVLCNNAGVMAFPEQATKDGYDVQMQTNSISPFLLTKELFPLLRRSVDGRVVNHSSAARLGADHHPRYFGKNTGNLGGDGTAEENAQFGGPRWERYHQSKLANCTFTYGLKARLEEQGITNVKALLAHPGLALTGLAGSSAATGGMDAEHELMKSAQSAEDGALAIIRGCADPNAVSGDFYGPREWTGMAERLEPEALLLDRDNIRINWEGCEAAVGSFQF